MKHEEDEEVSFYKKKMHLRMMHKRLKVGLVQWADISDDDKMLLMHYYNYDTDGFQM
ncbi:hypothetical protein GOV11_03515 [Candidatus Woesearchaeota archaeon]|nr:hypothetical protein [Candidatus Woesearchaeota archaeon]